MSFITHKVLLCSLCEKLVSIEDDNFPEDLHCLLSKYCIPQLYWICKSCEKQNVLKRSFGKRSNEGEMELLKARVECLEFEMTEIKKLVDPKAKKHDSSFLKVDEDSGLVSSSGLFGEISPGSQHDGNSCVSFRSYRKVDRHPISEDFQSIDACSSSESNCFQSMGSRSPTTAEDGRRSISPASSFSNIQVLNEASPKRKKEALALIHHISNTKIKIDDKESAKSSGIVDLFLKSITPFLKKDVVFNYLYSRDYRTGSSYTDLRISEASEYDVDIVLKAPSEINLEVEFFKETTAYAKIKWEKVGDIPSSKIDVLKFFEKNSVDGYLVPMKISAWFQRLTDLFVQSNPKIEGINQIKHHQSGPARTIDIVTDEGYILNIDLVPVIVFSYDVLATTKINEILEKYPVDKSKQFWFLVPKECTGEGQLLASDVKLSWRVDFPEVEKKVLHNKQSAKHIIRLLKLLRDKERWSIASYYIKTLILWRVHENPETSYWQGNFLFDRYLETMKFLQQCAKDLFLPFFMDPSYNLIHAFSKDECKNLSNRLQRIITLIERDHSNLNSIYS